MSLNTCLFEKCWWTTGEWNHLLLLPYSPIATDIDKDHTYFVKYERLKYNWWPYRETDLQLVQKSDRTIFLLFYISRPAVGLKITLSGTWEFSLYWREKEQGHDQVFSDLTAPCYGVSQLSESVANCIKGIGSYLWYCKAEHLTQISNLMNFHKSPAVFTTGSNETVRALCEICSSRAAVLSVAMMQLHL